MGEMTFEQTAMIKAGESTLAERSGGSGDLRVRTPGGRFQVRWDENGSCCRWCKSVEIWWHKVVVEFGVERLTNKGPSGPLVFDTA